MRLEAAGHDCVYATAGWGIHDERWVAALLEIGFHPHVVSLGRDAADALELREAVLAASTVGDQRRPVLAGPLHNVTFALADLPIPVVGLSWGYDLSDLDRELKSELKSNGADLSWLTHLRGLIIDSEANRAIALAAGVEADRLTFMPWGVDLDAFPSTLRGSTPSSWGASACAAGAQPSRSRAHLSGLRHHPRLRTRASP